MNNDPKWLREADKRAKQSKVDKPVNSAPNPSPASVPAGWYPEPSYGVGQRYWDGEKWTEHVYVSGQQYTSPIVTSTHEYAHTEQTNTKKKIYWGNLLRIRVWWFSLLTPIFLLFLLSLVGVPAELSAVLYLPGVAVTLWFWMHQQMACNHCGAILRVTRITGGQTVCQRCGGATD